MKLTAREERGLLSGKSSPVLPERSDRVKILGSSSLSAPRSAQHSHDGNRKVAEERKVQTEQSRNKKNPLKTQEVTLQRGRW
jgi:hypothetical protein